MKKILFFVLSLAFFSVNAQVKVPDYLQNYTSTKPTVYAVDLGGGYQQVADSAAKAGLSSDKRVVGMMVSYKKDGFWRTERYDGINTLTVNWINESNWSRIAESDSLSYYVLRVEMLDSLDSYATLDSLSNYLTDVQIKSVIHDSIEAQTFVSLGTSGQIPYINSTGTDLAYSDNFKFNGKRLDLKSSLGTGNIFIGDSSGRVSTGNYNTFLGFNSGYSNTTSGNNTFLGYRSGYSNTTGSSNTYIGYLSGEDGTSATGNTFLGYQSGANNTSSANTFIGYTSGQTNTSGTSNVSIGYQAGLTNNGNNNVFIGRQAGDGNTGSSNIIIGYQANITGSNKFVLENSNSATPLIYGNFADDSLIVNGTLEVTGNLVNESPHLPIYRIIDTTIAATQNVWYKIGGFTQKFTPVGMSVAGDSIQITKAGHFNIYFTISFSGLNNEVWEMAVFKNNSIEQPSQLRYTSTSDVGNVSCQVEVYSDGDDWFSFRIRNTTDGDDPTIKRFSVIIKSQHLE